MIFKVTPNDLPALFVICGPSELGGGGRLAMMIMAWSVRLRFVDRPPEPDSVWTLEMCLESGCERARTVPQSWNFNSSPDYYDFWPQEDAVLRVLTDLRNGSSSLAVSLLQYWKNFWDEASRRDIRQFYPDNDPIMFDAARAKWRDLWDKAAEGIEAVITVPRK